MGAERCDKENSLLKMCRHQENDSESSCSTKPCGKHSCRVITLPWKESVLEEAANEDPGTCGCLLRRNGDKAKIKLR